MAAGAEREFVDRVAWRLVGEHAPDELTLFEPVRIAYHHDAKRVLSDRRRRDETLGTGIDTVVTHLTLLALAVGGAVYQHLVDKADEKIVEGGGHWRGKLFRRKRTTPVAVEPLGEEQLAAVREVARRRALDLGLSAAAATEPADSLRGSLGG